MKKLIVSMLCFSILFNFVGCSVVSTKREETMYKQETENINESAEEIIEEKYEPIFTGNVVTTNDWEIKLTNAYTSTKLESNESRTAWDANDGYAFLILEFDVMCLNSTKPTIDGDAITELVANASGNTYENWKYQYINSEIWCYIRNTYLEANLPLHIYVYTMIPRNSMNSNVSVNLKLAGQPKEIVIS